MSRRDELRHVAGLVGIAASHVDALGVVHEPDEETLSQLIASFGLPSDPKQAADTLADEVQAAPFGLAPVQIVAQEDPSPVLRLRLPTGTSTVEWHCDLEDGSQRAGHTDECTERNHRRRFRYK